MKAKQRCELKLLEYLSNPENEWLTREKMCREVLGYATGNQIYEIFDLDELAEIEDRALKQRRKFYAKRINETDLALFQQARAGNLDAIKMVYQRFEKWSEKNVIEHTGAEGGPISFETMARQLMDEVDGKSREDK